MLMDITKKNSWLRLKNFRWLLVIAVSLLFVGWLLNTPSGLLGKADAIGYAVCHRIDLRSFHIGDRQVPLCARCTGMFLGALLGLCYQAYFGQKRSGAPPAQVIVVLVIFVFAFILDGLNSYVSLIPGIKSVYEPLNVLRLITGTGVGLVIAAALFPAFNQSVWKKIDRNSALGNLRSMGILVILALILDLIVLTENPFFLYPLALVSAAGVVVLLTIVYTIIFIMALRKECQYSNMKQLVYPLIAGFGMALFQLALLDIIRYWLTGTWDGFHLG
jgi:uncharacterized membrane protein